MTIAIEVADGDWGDALPQDIRAVCLSAADCFAAAVSEKPVESIRVEPSIDGLPRALYERLSTGQVRVRLSVRGRLWSRVAYQFAHELCHVLSNFRTDSPTANRWFEESLCETSSLFALRTMSRRWGHTAPYSNWAPYAPHLRSYADDVLAGVAGIGPAGETFGTWLERSLPSLQHDCYQRETNTVIAGQLLGVFEADPEAWRVVRYLNVWTTEAHVPSMEYFDAWRALTPIGSAPVLSRIHKCLIEGLERS